MPSFASMSPEDRSTLVARLADATDRFLTELIATGRKLVPQALESDRREFLHILGWDESELADFEAFDSDPRLSDLRTYALATGQELRLDRRSFDPNKPFHRETIVHRSVAPRVEVERSMDDAKWQATFKVPVTTGRGRSPRD